MNMLPEPATYAEAAERVRCLCALYSASVTSNLRTERHNAAVGGHQLSKHRIYPHGGVAWDLVPDDNSNEQRVRLGDAARQFGFYVLVESDHVHLQSKAPG